MKVEIESRSALEPVKLGTLVKLITTVNRRINDSGNKPGADFVSNDDKEGYARGTHATLYRGRDINIFIFENLYEKNSRNAASVLLSYYHLSGRGMELILPKDLSKKGKVFEARVKELVADCITEGGDTGLQVYRPSESHTQRVLTLVEKMKPHSYITS